MTNTAFEMTKSRKNFYRDIYRKEIVILIVLLLMVFVWIAMIMYVATHRVVPDFYASTSDGILYPLKSMPAPNQSDKPLLD